MYFQRSLMIAFSKEPWRSRVLLTVMICLFPAFLPAMASATSCRGADYRFNPSNFVALVKVESIEPFGGVRALASIEEVFSDIDDERTHVVLIGDRPNPCSLPLQVGTRYLIFGWRAPGEEEAYLAGFGTARRYQAEDTLETVLNIARDLFHAGGAQAASDYLRRVAERTSNDSERKTLLRTARSIDQANEIIVRAVTEVRANQVSRALDRLDALEEDLGISNYWMKSLKEETLTSVRDHFCPAAHTAYDEGRLVESLRLATLCRSILLDFQIAAAVINGLEERAMRLDEEARELEEKDLSLALTKWREALSITASNSLLHRRLKGRHPSLRD